MTRQNLTLLPVLLCVSIMAGCTDPIAQKRHELCNYVPGGQQFDENARIDGKIAVIYKKGNYNPQFDNRCDMDGHSGRSETAYFPDEMYARSPDELDTLIMIEEKKGDFLKTTQWRMTESPGWTTDVYSCQLAISIINYKTSTLIRNSVREFTKIPEKISLSDLKLGNANRSINDEYIVEPTRADIRNALKEFSDNVKEN